MRPDPRTVPGLAEALPGLLSSLERDESPRNVTCVAEALWMSGDPEAAIRLLGPLTAGGRGGVAAHLLLSWCHEDARRARAAAEALAAAHRLDPENPYAGGDVLEDEESRAEPERALSPQELGRIPPGQLFSATLAEIFERQGFEEKALEIYREVVRVHPDRDDVRQRIDDLARRRDEGEFDG